MILAEMRGAFLFQVRPDLFPEGFLTETETELWNYYYDWREKSQG